MKDENLNAGSMKNLLFAVIGFILRSGMSRSDLSAVFQQCMDAYLAIDDVAELGARKSRPADDFAAAAVIKVWHRDPRYLTKNACPKPLALHGRAPSVESLVRGMRSGISARECIRNLKSAKLIRLSSRGKYVPTREFATLNQLHPLMVEHVSKSILRLVETVDRNTNPRGSKLRLIERFARIPDLDPEQARAFANFTHRQGLAYLQAVDDWLETRRVRPSPRSSANESIGAGVHLYAYMGNDSDDIASLDLAERAAESSRRSSSAARSGSKRAVALCRTSGIAA